MAPKKKAETEAPTEATQLVRTSDEGTIVNNHPLPVGTVIDIPLSMIEAHRNAGVSLHDVEDDYKGDVYDVNAEYQVPGNEAA